MPYGRSVDGTEDGGRSGLINAVKGRLEFPVENRYHEVHIPVLIML
jgi:hypothetical protein